MKPLNVEDLLETQQEICEWLWAQISGLMLDQ